MKQLLSLLIQLTKWVNEATTDGYEGIIATTKIAVVVTPFIYLYNKLAAWTINNEDYILIVLGAIMIDWTFGFIKHLMQRSFSIKQMAIGLTMKFALALAGGFLFEGLNFLVREADLILTSSKIVTRVIILMYPALSAFENIYYVSGEKFPPKAWMERLKKWQNSLDPNDLINKKDTNEQGE